MKRLILSKLVFAIVMLISASFALSSCSKSNDEVPTRNQGKIEDAVGTYKGTIKIYGLDSPSELYNVIIEVSKASDNSLRVKAKSGETYSIVTEKVFKVSVTDSFNPDPVDVVSLSGSTEGLFHYDGVAKTISVITNKQSETDIYYSFEGDKM